MSADLARVQAERIYSVPRPERDRKKSNDREAEPEFVLEGQPKPEPELTEEGEFEDPALEHGSLGEREDNESGGRLDVTG